MEDNKIKIPHNVVMENRKRLNISGVSDVDSFDEQMIAVFTDMGELTIKGSDLHIIKLSVETGDLTVEGSIYGLVYADDGPKKEGFLSKVFR